MTILRPATDQFRERILVFGSFSSGKSYAWLQIARWAMKTKSAARFFVLDTDDAIARMLWSEEFRDLTDRIVLYEAYEWPDYERFLREVEPQIQPDDWLVLDFVSAAWDAIQRHYVEEIFTQDIGAFFLEARKQLKGNTLQPLDGWKDWSVINKIYSTWAVRAIKRQRCHVFATAHEEKVVEKDDKETQTLFGALGFKPGGQKHLGHHFHTVLRLHRARTSDWRMTTIKDRQRPLLDGESWKDFVLSYLVKVAGWKL